MEMLLKNLNKRVSAELLRFAWRQWSQLGVAGDVEFRDSWIIDPEALLLFTMRIGRRDPRLFDEVIDWTMRNGRWVSLQRLKNLTETAGDETRRAIAASAAVVDSCDTRHRWRSLLRLSQTEVAEPVPFFTDQQGVPLPVIGEPDEHFLTYGFSRSGIVLRGLSVAVPMQPATNLLFKLRSLFGLGPRAEVVAYLLMRDGGRPSMIARSAVYSHPPVIDALRELAQSGLVFNRVRGHYSLETERWRQFLELPMPLPAWVQWPRVFAALSVLLEGLDQMAGRPMSDYLMRSAALTLNETMREALANSGIPNPFLPSCALEHATEALEQRVAKLTDTLNAHTPRVR